ncbi:beta-lactamase family protein [Streptomyces sp. TRM66268-LWL]|uniref:Beta-lactamase family protein n=1 Tax=Streptomyces polyasparticus TaxID=2767826 RepID=A0ABR7SPI8_9ACTN|nr:serine hydrolase domain-containing protein [Streptomyces polyasparticus]MBC9717289.1 beta-lactamase family protein [Streptomyces polyasparticus]
MPDHRPAAGTDAPARARPAAHVLVRTKALLTAGAFLATTLTSCDASPWDSVPPPTSSVPRAGNSYPPQDAKPTTPRGTGDATPASPRGTGEPGIPPYDLAEQSILVELAEDSPAPGVAALVSRDSRTWFGAAGHATYGSARPPRREDHFRIGTLSQTFIAVVVLQLAAEGRIGLADPVERHLPGLLRGNGHDGRRILVLHLLVHNAGLHPYLQDRKSPYRSYDRRYTAADLVRLGLSRPPESPPGLNYRDSHAHYAVLGLLIERLTGRSYAAEVRRRILDPLDLTGTSFPGTRRDLPSPHGSAYGGRASKPTDLTEIDPTVLGAGGEMISTLDDLNRFYTALLRGSLLPKAQLARMLDVSDGMGHAGLGIGLYEVSCGARLWTASNELAGTSVQTVVSHSGDHATTLFANADWLSATIAGSDTLMETEFCGRPDPHRPPEP